MIKFLHAADLHLDSPFSALAPEQAAARRQTQRALPMQILELADTHDCDLVLLAGDLFDSASVDPDTVRALLRACSACRAEIFIAPGNHDFCTSASPYHTEVWPENVHIFTSHTIDCVELPRLGCRVFGAAFTASTAPALLDGFHAPRDGTLNLMVLHGDAVTAASPYNAISQSQIAASGLDYLALGHIHAQSGLLRAGDTAYAWPGCPMGRGFDELGQKGVYLGTLHDGRCTLTFCPMDGIVYGILRVEAGDDPLAAIEAALPPDPQNAICRIVLTGEAPEIDLPALRSALAPRLFGLSLRDETIPRRDLWENCGEDTLRGLFLQQLRQQYDAAPDDETRRIITQAARFGLHAMDHQEVTL